MLRIRFHGRGGQGMKTASRILGSAAFHSGYIVQDSPIYGAERRGAPMAALVRMAHTPIHERGLLTHPDLVTLADDTLLADPAAQPLAGCDAACALLINSTKSEAALRQIIPLASQHVYIADFMMLVRHHTRTTSGLSTALGVAAAGLCGLPWSDIEAGLSQELTDHLNAEQWQHNLELARATHALVSQWVSITERNEPSFMPLSPIVEVPFDPPRIATPSIYAPANSPERKTGNWRQFRPVLHQDKCTRCWICFVRCPEAAISLDAQDYPAVNYEECKGCLLCVHECPTHAFTAEAEVR